MMNQDDIKKILNVGVMLSSERNLNKLLEKILTSVMDIAHCDAGTLYLLNDDKLYFTIMRNNTMKVYQGGDGNLPDVPPVPLTRDSVCAISIIDRKTINIPDVDNCVEYDLTGPKKYDKMTGYHTESMIAVPMRNREGENLGVLQLINAKDANGNVCAFSDEMELVLESVSSQAALAIQNVRYIDEIHELFDSFVKVFVSAIEERSPYNGNHTKHMVEYADKFIDYINNKDKNNIRFDSNHKKEFLTSVWLHDVGKLVIPLEVMDKNARLTPEQYREFMHRMKDILLIGEINKVSSDIDFNELNKEVNEAKELVDSINSAGYVTDEKIESLDKFVHKTYRDTDGTNKPWITKDEYNMLTIRKGTLSPDERNIMQSHAVMTDKLLSQIQFSEELSHVRKWASSHHEFLSGEGYPNHLSNDNIPEEVRILTIIDIFEALTAKDRPYKPGVPVKRALSILKDMAEKEGKLDKTLVDEFIKSECWC